KREGTQTLREKLLSIKGIGRETADSILLYALEKPSFVVDAYTKRLFYRIGITDSESISYEHLKSFVEGQIPPLEENIEIYKELHALIVVHCKEKCRRKPECRECPLRKECPYDRIRCTARP
ncbi:MAG: endonuclease, partial [Desulfurobacteriaceae bacterium]